MGCGGVGVCWGDPIKLCINIFLLDICYWGRNCGREQRKILEYQFGKILLIESKRSRRKQQVNHLRSMSEWAEEQMPWGYRGIGKRQALLRTREERKLWRTIVVHVLKGPVTSRYDSEVNVGLEKNLINFEISSPVWLLKNKFCLSLTFSIHIYKWHLETICSFVKGHFQLHKHKIKFWNKISFWCLL